MSKEKMADMTNCCGSEGQDMKQMMSKMKDCCENTTEKEIADCCSTIKNMCCSESDDSKSECC